MAASANDVSAEQVTARFDDFGWVGPVATLDELLALRPREGTCCFVSEENAIYEFRLGTWRCAASRA